MAREMSDVEADERAYEQSAEAKEAFLEEPEQGPVTIPQIEIAPRPSVVPVAAVPKRDEVTLRVEKILEDGLGDLYASLPDSAKPLFKKKGEEVASEIATMTRTLKVQLSRLIRLIRDWLLTVPKVNRYFLEQEAKIKADKVLELVAARREELHGKSS